MMPPKKSTTEPKMDITASSPQSLQAYTESVLSPQTGNASVRKKSVSSAADAGKLKGGKERALKACDSCRKKKTKCFPSNNSIACFRCSFHGIICSFEKEAISNDLHSGGPNSMISLDFDAGDKALDSTAIRISNSNGGNGGGGTGKALVDARLKMLQNDVNEILHLLKTTPAGHGQGSESLEEETRWKPVPLGADVAADRGADVTPLTDISKVKLFQYNNSVVDLNNLPSFGESTVALRTCPFRTFADVSSHLQIETPVSRSVRNQPVAVPQHDLISLGILTYDECVTLLQHFRERYGRWVSFPEEMSSAVLLLHIKQRCSLLLTVCCALALRYGEAGLKARVYDAIIVRLHTELNENLARTPQSLEFLQSIAVLSLYSISLSQDDLQLDSWYLSGIGLQHFISKDLSGQLFEPQNIPDYVGEEFYKLLVYRIWNHLALAHLVYCVFTGRMCIVDELRLCISRKILELSNSTNFDGRIVAEISCQLIVYNFIQFGNQSHSLTAVKEDMSNWFDQWSYLFEQPTNQFVGLNYHYGYLNILYNWNLKKLKSNGDSDDILMRIDSASIRNMIFHCQKIIETMLDTHNDSYFAFLSDQVHFSCNFGILMLLKILNALNLQNYTELGDDLNRVEMSKNELHKNLSNCIKLSNRYKRVSSGEGDIFMKYHATIGQTVERLFPDFAAAGAD